MGFNSVFKVLKYKLYSTVAGYCPGYCQESFKRMVPVKYF